jgi:putative redox protein
VEESGAGRYTQAARSGNNVLTIDEPRAVGGDDAGPGPYEMLLMGLGACTSMTLRMYAELKKLPLEKVSVRLSHRRIHAQDCSDCGTKEGKVDEITREITLVGNLDETQRARLLEIANRCPVHRTLSSEIKIRSRLA